ncbi:D-alanyl-D-alanine carboxypeptidase/D-alanyl-D-alanine-endopeptidase [Arthrobacter echini]|uniref:D-alanyl-D-alanine carboxypeptidase/D-alanyl-D-alanine-endopeptidase n=1 Tax=Arthrobacter echini TaxID=1529066 RepID=A0A4S5E1G0_9MICC|nr:D-alanyl-D-alanine carboxypeptidase/D-alanyl-D-alanine-endopeptidase [Arthrobacter echini]THJ65133.1 D-alanyl-D-alanine carboxypeptidase/D-alanyl-D-alanine-endopeptidase [Arthrobacter echini]
MTRPLALLAGLLLLLVGSIVVPAVVDPAPSGPPPVVPAQQLVPATVPVPDVVTPLSASAPGPDPATLAMQLGTALRLEGPGDFAGTVVDPSDGSVLFSRDAGRLQAPASNIKVFTAAAALTYAEPGDRLTTSVLLSGARPGVLYLHGGGDVLLGAGDSAPDAVVGRAGLGTLAREAAEALAPGSGPYEVRLDDSLFVGPALNPTWAQGDIDAGQIAPVHALAVDPAGPGQGWAGGPHSQDAALDAAGTFVAALTAAAAERGITIDTGSTGSTSNTGVQRESAPRDAALLAAVESAPLQDQVRHMLEASDNYLAEALARIAALGSGRPASFDGATQALTAVAASLGVPVEGLLIGDAAGLSVENAVSPEQLAALIRGITTSADPSLAAVARSLPIAGATGTLTERFSASESASGSASAAGAGVVRAKTGTLNAVTALSGYTVTVDGRLLVFSFLAAGLDGNTAEARSAADGAAAVLSTCGCR